MTPCFPLIHTPKKHPNHTDNISCGCSEVGKTDRVICRYCGAAYTDEALSFPVWRCYDCGASDMFKRYF